MPVAECPMARGRASCAVAGVELEIRLLVDHRERLIRSRVALNNDLLWHLHDLWPQLKLPGSALFLNDVVDVVDADRAAPSPTIS